MPGASSGLLAALTICTITIKSDAAFVTSLPLSSCPGPWPGLRGYHRSPSSPSQPPILAIQGMQACPLAGAFRLHCLIGPSAPGSSSSWRVALRILPAAAGNTKAWQQDDQEEGVTRDEGQVLIAFTVSEEDGVAGTAEGGEARLAPILHARFPALFPSLSAARWAVRRKEVGVGDEMGKTDTPVFGGDSVVVYARGKSPFRKQLREAGRDKKVPEIAVLFEDSHVAAVVKPQGMPMYYDTSSRAQQADGRLDLTTLLEPLLAAPTEGTPLRRAAAVHRLDKATGGVVLCAKTKEAARGAAEQFEKREVQKRYRAVVMGRVVEGGEMSSEVEGKEALTLYEPVRSVQSLKFGWVTLLDLFPRTGRKHQLRVQLAARSTPICGDKRHGVWMARLDPTSPWLPLGESQAEELSRVSEGRCSDDLMQTLWLPSGGEEAVHSTRLQYRGMLLWAAGLSLSHPIDGSPLELEAPMPRKFEGYLDKEELRWERVQATRSEQQPQETTLSQDPGTASSLP